MKKLLCMIMLLNIAPVAFGSNNDLSNTVGKTLGDAALLTTFVTACTIRAAIPFATVASLANQATKTNSRRELNKIDDKLYYSAWKSFWAIPCYLETKFELKTSRKLAPKLNLSRLKTFFGAHALSLVAVPFVHNLIDEKTTRLKEEELKEIIRSKKSIDC